MMRTPSGGYSDPGLQREVKELRKQVDVLSRRRVEMPKTPPPVAGGGGIVGQATVESVFGTLVNNFDRSGYNQASIRWEAPYDPSGQGGDTSWLTTDPANPSRLRLPQDYFAATIHLSIMWSDPAVAPDTIILGLDPAMKWGGNQRHASIATSNIYRSGNRGVQGAVVHTGPFWSDGNNLNLRIDYNREAVPEPDVPSPRVCITFTRFG